MEIAANPSFDLAAVKMPWRWSLLLLVVFAFACPFNPSQAGGRLDMEQDAYEAQVETGNVVRQVALLSLGSFAIVELFRRKRGRLKVNGLLGWSTLLYVSMALASPAWAEDPSLAIRRAGVLLVLFLGALATTARFSLIRIAALAVCVCGFTLFISLVVELASGTFGPFDETWRFSGVLHPVTQGWNCGLLVIASLALAGGVPRSRWRLICLALAAFLFLGLTRSRMPLVSTVLAAGVLGAFTSLGTRKLTFAVAYVLIACASFLWFVLFILGGNFGRTAGMVGAMGRGDEATSTLGTFTGRQELWDQELSYAAKRPILGYGYNAFLDPSNVASLSKVTGWVPTSAHSGFIGALLGLGIVGAGIFVLVLALALKRSLSLARQGPNAAFAAAVMIWLCCNLFLESPIIMDPTFPTFICLAVLASLAFEDGSHAFRFFHPPTAPQYNQP